VCVSVYVSICARAPMVSRLVGGRARACRSASGRARACACAHVCENSRYNKKVEVVRFHASRWNAATRYLVLNDLYDFEY